MLIDKSLCVNCGRCISRCPVRAIRRDKDNNVYIDWGECVECNTCTKSKVCPKNAIYQQELTWPRIVRYWMSDEQGKFIGADGPGRGTEEAKTNDVTGRYPPGVIGFALEFGRPGIGARIYDIEKMAQRLARLDCVDFEPRNPVTMMMEDPKRGRFKEELLNEKILSGILECVVPEDRAAEVIGVIADTSPDLHTVFSFGMFSRIDENGEAAHVRIARQLGLTVSPNGKNNVGLGKPYKD